MDYFTISINCGGGVLIEILKYLCGGEAGPTADPCATPHHNGNGEENWPNVRTKQIEMISNSEIMQYNVQLLSFCSKRIQGIL
jgi:hypothetical protein